MKGSWGGREPCRHWEMNSKMFVCLKGSMVQFGAPTWGGSELPGTPAPGDFAPSAGLLSHLQSYAQLPQHTHN